MTFRMTCHRPPSIAVFQTAATSLRTGRLIHRPLLLAQSRLLAQGHCTVTRGEYRT
jgi:hypothetical protein